MSKNNKQMNSERSTKMPNTTRYLAIFLIVAGGLLAYAAAWNDVIIVDEDPHIASGLSYVMKRDMRLNPEHPPVVKWLAAAPLTLIPDLNVPFEHPTWVNETNDPKLVNAQWEFGRELLFNSGNDADLMTRLARIGPTLLMLLLAWFVFRWAYEKGGSGAGLIALLLFVTSPVILGHGILVTTDVPAALGLFVAPFFFIRFLHRPSRKTLLWAGMSFGLAQLMKFSVVLLIPYYGILAVAWWLLVLFSSKNEDVRSPDTVRRPFMTYVGGTVITGIIGLAVIYVVYWLTATSGYPADRQLFDTQVLAGAFPSEAAASFVIWIASIPILRPLAQYILGLFMVIQRAAGGNTTFFLGEVARDSWFTYFPIVYLIKMRLAVHALTALAFVVGAMATMRAIFPTGTYRAAQAGTRLCKRSAEFSKKHFDELAMLLFIAIYWASTLTSNLNIGLRHLAPTLPFLFVLIALGIKSFTAIRTKEISGLGIKAFMQSTKRAGLIALLLIWAVLAGLAPFPQYIASFNELVSLRGGGEEWVVDSNIDWGQDLKRLAWFVEDNDIEEITINYFGKASVDYYMPEGTVVNGWWADWPGQPEGWFAVSTTFKQQACATPVRGFGDRPQDNYDGYCFLSKYEPVTKIGESIYVYNLPSS